jgi:two-component system, LytTR family, response regulator
MNAENISTEAAKAIQGQELLIQIVKQNGFYNLRLKDILLCTSEGIGTKVYLLSGETLEVTKSLKWFEEQLSHYGFVRVHHQYLVNVFHIHCAAIEKDGYMLKLHGDKRAKVSRSMKKQLMSALAQLSISPQHTLNNVNGTM